MLDRNAVRLLKKFGLRFQWNKTEKQWWFQKSARNGNVKRTLPVPAANKAEAEDAVNEYFQKMRRNFDVRQRT